MLSTRMLAPLASVTQILNRWQQARIASESLDKIMMLPVDRPENVKRIHKPVIEGAYHFRNAVFAYGEQPALTVADLKIAPGSKVGIIGRNGAGKSTLLQGLSGLLEAQSGTVLLDSVNIAHIDPADLRRRVGLVSQNARLFYGTIRENLALGAPNASDVELVAALERTGALEFVSRLPEGLDYVLQEGGIGLSGGQKQALLLSRLLLREPSIILLDEPTTALDETAEQKVLAALSELPPETTLFVATHKPSVLAVVDRLVVVSGGKIIMDGPRDQILTRLRKGEAKAAAPARCGEGGSLMAASDYDSLIDGDEITASGANKVVLALTLMLVAFAAWAYFFSVEEVSSGPGTVVPLSHEQVIQSFDGGILAELNVSTGEIVDKGEVLAELDPTRARAQYDETAARYRAALAQATRLQAEVTGADHVSFPAALDGYPELTASEEALFQARQGSFHESLSDMKADMALIEQQLKLTEPLLETGAASKVELIRLQRDMADIKLKMDDMRSKYMVENGEKLAEAQAQVATLLSSLNGLEDTLSHTTIRSPAHGIVKEIEVTTIGGVVSPNGALMTIVPLGDQLRIEARISPRDYRLYPSEASRRW